MSIVDVTKRLRSFVDGMDPRKFLKRLARELGLLRNDSTTTKPAEKVSEPANFEHRVHVALDEDSGRFVGLPPQWKQVVGKNKLDEYSTDETAPFVSRGKAFTQRRRRTHDDNALDRGLSRTNAGNFASFAASLETPRSRASVADSQDLIIERLKRELRDYKARNSGAFDESFEDVFTQHSSNERIFNATQSLNIARPYRVSPVNRGGRFNSTIGMPPRNHSYEFDETLEDDFVPSQNEQYSTNNGNIAQSSQSSLSPSKNRNANGDIPRQSPTKLHGLKQNGNPRVFRRSESEV